MDYPPIFDKIWCCCVTRPLGELDTVKMHGRAQIGKGLTFCKSLTVELSNPRNTSGPNKDGLDLTSCSASNTKWQRNVNAHLSEWQVGDWRKYVLHPRCIKSNTKVQINCEQLIQWDQVIGTASWSNASDQWVLMDIELTTYSWLNLQGHTNDT